MGSVFQSGPGSPCQSPEQIPNVETILSRGYHIFCLDQRGTRLSNYVTAAKLQEERNHAAHAAYSKLFRADNVVRDCEETRQHLTADHVNKKWYMLGHGLAGLCIWTYPSQYPEGLEEAFCVGGIPPISKSIDEVCQATFSKTMERNREYFKKYGKQDLYDLVKILNDNLQNFPVEVF